MCRISRVCLPPQVLARIALNQQQFDRVLTELMRLFRTNRELLEQRGSLIIRNLCVHLHAENIYIALSAILQKEEDLAFARVMIQVGPPSGQGGGGKGMRRAGCGVDGWGRGRAPPLRKIHARCIDNVCMWGG